MLKLILLNPCKSESCGALAKARESDGVNLRPADSQKTFQQASLESSLDSQTI